MSRPPASINGDEAFRGSFSNLSLSTTPPLDQTSAHSSTSPATVPSSSFVPSNLSTDDPHYLLRLSISLFIEGLDILYRDMASPLPPSTPITSATLSRAAELLSHTLTKYLLLLSRTSATDRPLVLKETEQLSHAVTNLCCQLRALLSPPCGNTLAAATVALGRSLLSSLRQSVLSLQATVISGDPVNVQRAGQVWEVCQSIEKAAVTDKDAVGREVAAVLRLIKDAKQEVASLTLSTQDNTTQEGAEGGEEDEFSDEDDEGLSVEEYALVPVTSDFIAFAFSLTRLVYSVVLKATHSTQNTQWMEAQLSTLRAISSAVDTLVHALYPPQSRTALTAAYTTLSALMCDVLIALLSHTQWSAVYGDVVRGSDAVTGGSGGSVAGGLECRVCGVHVSGERVVDESSRVERRWVYACMGKVHSLHIRAGVEAQQAVSVCGGL